jgi:hypothetical protein
MAQKYGKAGKSTYQMADKRGKQVIFILLLGLGSALVIYLLLSNSSALGLSGGAVLVLLVLLRVLPDFFEKKAKQKEKEERRAIRGAKAEEKVESLLDDLGEGYLVLHDVESQYGNIDHLVISQTGGVFLIETKAHGGKVTLADGKLQVNGHDPEKDFIAQCLRNAFWVRDQIQRLIGVKPWITPLLVFTNAFVQGSLTIKGIHVLNKKYLLPVIQGKQIKNSVTNTIWEKREAIAHLLMQNNDRI